MFTKTRVLVIVAVLIAIPAGFATAQSDPDSNEAEVEAVRVNCESFGTEAVEDAVNGCYELKGGDDPGLTEEERDDAEMRAICTAIPKEAAADNKYCHPFIGLGPAPEAPSPVMPEGEE